MVIIPGSIGQVRSQQAVPQWSRFEFALNSLTDYHDPVYQVDEFYAIFTSPTGRELRINGFWDGAISWKIRFAPDEIGSWQYKTVCSDTLNTGLHQVAGTFDCTENTSEIGFYQHGGIIHHPGTYYLTHQDGTPFFWTACTAWNGALKSTDQEWHQYLQHRADHNYNVIQFVTTQWRGADQNSQGQVAYEGSGKITINPEFFQHLDKKIDEINQYGLVAAPVVLWALPGVREGI
jgi:hypothetical protein